MKGNIGRTMQLISDNELYHFNPNHDKLGRFASKAAGVIKKPAKVKKNLLNNYYKRDETTVKKYLKKKGYSEEQINRQLSKRRENRKKMLKRAAIIAGGLTLAATSYYMYKHVGHKYMNDIIKSGTAMQTVHGNANRLNEGNLFYTTPQKEGDAYIGLFGEKMGLFGFKDGNKNKITYNFSKDKKIASIHESKKIFDNMMKEPEMKSMFEDIKKENSIVDLNYVGYMRGYDYFNRIGMMLDDSDSRVKKIKSRFIDDTLKAGFDGIKDINDIKNGMSDHPYIILNKDGIQNVKSAVLSDSEIRDKKNINIAKILGKNTIKTYYPFIIAGSGAYGLAIKNKKYDENIEQKIKGEKK